MIDRRTSADDSFVRQGFPRTEAGCGRCLTRDRVVQLY
jgi:hypothetical protein